LKDDVKTFYAANMANMPYVDMLTLLSFADSQKHELSKLGVDTRYITDFYQELLQQYTSTMESLMKVTRFSRSAYEGLQLTLALLE
jgi:hypothetical protein